MRTLIAAGALAAGTLVVPVAASAPPALANPCAQSPWVTMKLMKPYVDLRKNGDDSIYNRTQDPVTRTLDYGYSHTYQVQKSWEVGGSAGISWSIVSANVSTKYGKTYTQSDAVSAGEHTTMTIRPRYTGWTRLVVYRHPIVWKKLRDTWTGTECKVHVIAKALWQPPKHQMVPITKKGHHFPA
jgi:hypothetical protein